MSTPKIYVIIVTWNGMKWIDKCLSCLRHSSLEVNIIVVDNGSTDETVEYIHENYSEVQLYAMSKNLGFGQANNYGIKIAMENHSDFVYLLNQDAYVYPDMFEKLLNVYEESNDKTIGILSPLHLYRDGKHFDNQYKSYLYGPATTMIEDLLLNNLKSYYEVEAVPAAGWLIPTSTIEKIGGFDPIFFHYGEDHNYAQRVRYHGLRSLVVPSAKMIHDRDGFGNESMAKKDMYFRTVKTEIMLNINLTKSEIFKMLIKSDIKNGIESVKQLLHGNYYMFWELQKATKLNLMHLRKYRMDRKQNRIVGKNWL